MDTRILGIWVLTNNVYLLSAKAHFSNHIIPTTQDTHLVTTEKLKELQENYGLTENHLKTIIE